MSPIAEIWIVFEVLEGFCRYHGLHFVTKYYWISYRRSPSRCSWKSDNTNKASVFFTGIRLLINFLEATMIKENSTISWIASFQPATFIFWYNYWTHNNDTGRDPKASNTCCTITRWSLRDAEFVPFFGKRRKLIGRFSVQPSTTEKKSAHHCFNTMRHIWAKISIAYMNMYTLYRSPVVNQRVFCTIRSSYLNFCISV